MSRSGLKKLCVRFYHQTSFWGASNIDYENNCAHLKMKVRLVSFSYTVWFMISETNITRCLFLHRGACMHQKSQRGMQKMWTSGFYSWTQVYTYRRTRRQEFQNILERKLCHCFGQYWKMLNMNLNMILIVLLIGEIRLLEIPEMYSKFYEDLSI